MTGLEKSPERIAAHKRACELQFPVWIMEKSPQEFGDEYPGFDAVYRFEHIQEEFSAITKKLGVNNITLPHTNRSTRDRYQDYYDKASKERVQNIYAHRISKFGYKFEE